MNMQEEKQVTIHINGCHVTVPASQEQIYREALADKWVNNHHIYVKNGEVVTDLDPSKDRLNPDELEQILLEETEKNYALISKLFS